MSEEDDGASGGAGRDGRRAGFSLRRWSQRKHEAARETKEPAPVRQASPPALVRQASPPAPVRQASPPPTGAQPARAPAVPELPPIETLTADSDFAPFMRAGVDPDLRRAALKKLLHDPRFNVMDGLDVYIDDYTKTKPIDPSLAQRILARLHPGSLAGEEPVAATVTGAGGTTEDAATSASAGPATAATAATAGGADAAVEPAAADGSPDGPPAPDSEQER